MYRHRQVSVPVRVFRPAGWLIWCAIVACWTHTGCATRYFAETRLHSDGSVDRAVWQPRDNPAAVEEQRESWEEVVRVRDLPRQEQPLDIRRWASQHAADEGTFLAAWGRFSAVDAIPDHMRFPTPDGEQQGKLVRTHTRRRLPLVVEHHWEETLVDVVSLREMRSAQTRLMDSIVHDTKELLTLRWGEEYDISGLIEWLETAGRSWLADAVDTIYDTLARHPQNGDEKLGQQLSEVASQYGWHWESAESAPSGNDTRDETAEQIDPGRVAWEEFLRNLLREQLRRPDGQPLTPETIHRLVDEISMMLFGPAGDESGEARPPDEARERLEAWQTALATLIDRRYGSREACEQHYLNLAARILGVYRLPFASVNARLAYSLEMPGTIVETTGRLVAENRVTWDFAASSAFPYGYEMSCRSLEPDAAGQQALLGRVSLTSRPALLEYVQLLERQPDLHRVLEQCERELSLAPLGQYRQRLENERRSASRPEGPTAVESRLSSLARMEELLDLPRP